MKAIIEFELPDDQSEYEMAVDAPKMYNALWQIKQLLRSKLKYNPDELTDAELKQWEIMQDEFHLILDEQNIQFYV
jgi:hypothetical protein